MSTIIRSVKHLECLIYIIYKLTTKYKLICAGAKIEIYNKPK